LAGIFLYTTTVDNRIGKEAVAHVTSELVTSFSKLQGTIKFSEPSNTNTTDSTDKIIQKYLSNVEESYSDIKTLLYRDQPKPFYSFYVPNNIVQSIGRDKSNTIHKINSKSLTMISHFIIVVGIGGLGKSMMMRHLLLNAIQDYGTFHHVPVFISLKDYNGSNLTDFIYSKSK
jgi:hypothetical protein